MRKVTIAWYGYVLNGDSNVKGRVICARNVHLKRSWRTIACVSYTYDFTRWVCCSDYRVRTERNVKVGKSGLQRVIHRYKNS